MNNRFYGEFDFEHLPGSRPENDPRSPFQIDRDRVLFSSYFRQLQSKTQVFQSGEYDFYRTRLTHTIEVARIARSIAEFLNAHSNRLKTDYAIDCDLVEAVGLAHDLGHPPFGHIGERKLNEIMRQSGGFEGNAQTLRILTELIFTRNNNRQGMKPTRAFLDGVLKYKALHKDSGTKDKNVKIIPPENHFLYDEQLPIRDFVFQEAKLEKMDAQSWNSLKSIECQIMDWADDTAYSLHDIVDGVKAGFITTERLKNWGEKQNDLSDYQLQVLSDLIDTIHKGGYEPRTALRIGQFIQGSKLEPIDSPLAHLSNRHRYRLSIEPKIHEVCSLHKRIAIDLIFKSAPLQQVEFKGGKILSELFDGIRENVHGQVEKPLNILPEPISTWVREAESAREKDRIVCDHLSSLTDGQAVRFYKKLFVPEFGSLMDLY